MGRQHREFWDDRDREPAGIVIHPRVALVFTLLMILALFGLIMAMENAPSASASPAVQVATCATGDAVTRVQQRLAAFGYTVAVDGDYGPQTTRAVRHFQKVNGLVADGIAGPITSAALGITAGATAVSPAVRGAQTQITPPPPAPVSFDAKCPQYVGLVEFFSPGWDVQRMDAIMYRESRCRPDVTSNTGCCRGLFQIHQLHVPNLGVCGVYSASDLFDPGKNVCAAAVVYRRAGGMSPWAL